MLMWSIILGSLLVITGISLFYVSLCVAGFPFVRKFSKSSEKRRKIIGLTTVCCIFTILCLTLNVMNAAVCLIHFAVFFLLCGFAFKAIQKITKKEFKRNYADTTAVFLSLLTLSAGWYLNHHVFTTHYVVETEKKVKDLRVVFFADSHIGTTFDGEKFAEHVKKMQTFSPDIVFVVGDFVDDDTTKRDMIAASKALSALETTYGVYFVFGNHDEGYHDAHKRGFTKADLIKELQKNNVSVLQDDIVFLDDAFAVIGRKDVSENHRRRTRLPMKELAKSIDKDYFSIVLDHQPNDYDNQEKAKVDLVLSGHTHGGQLFPLTKVGEWIGANDKTYGLERRSETNFIVTSGISDWTLKFKTGAKSEFVIVDIKQKN